MPNKIPNPNFQIVIKFTRIASLIFIVIYFFYFSFRDLNPSGTREVKYDFCQLSPYISELSPMGRVLAIERTEGYCFQRMVIDPVYVDVRLPQRYDAVIVRAEFNKPPAQPLSLGVRTSLYEWQWKMEVFAAEAREGWQTQEVRFDIIAMPLENRRIRFIISSPGLVETGREIEFRGLTFIFEKPPLNMAMVKRWLASFCSGCL